MFLHIQPSASSVLLKTDPEAFVCAGSSTNEVLEEVEGSVSPSASVLMVVVSDTVVDTDEGAVEDAAEAIVECGSIVVVAELMFVLASSAGELVEEDGFVGGLLEDCIEEEDCVAAGVEVFGADAANVVLGSEVEVIAGVDVASGVEAIAGTDVSGSFGTAWQPPHACMPQNCTSMGRPW